MGKNILLILLLGLFNASTVFAGLNNNLIETDGTFFNPARKATVKNELAAFLLEKMGPNNESLLCNSKKDTCLLSGVSIQPSFNDTVFIYGTSSDLLRMYRGFENEGNFAKRFADWSSRSGASCSGCGGSTTYRITMYLDIIEQEFVPAK